MTKRLMMFAAFLAATLVATAADEKSAGDGFVHLFNGKT